MMLMALGFTTSAGGSTLAAREAVEATVTGNDQQVGFRALVMQGDKQRIDSALATIQNGTKKSSDIKITTTPATINPDLNAFTVVDWTSTSRNITNKYNLVFELRTTDAEISPADAKTAWRQILEKTLNSDDLKKLRPDD